MSRSRHIPRDLVPVEVVAQELGVSPTTVWRLAARGQLSRVAWWGRTLFNLREVEALRQRRAARRVVRHAR